MRKKPYELNRIHGGHTNVGRHPEWWQSCCTGKKSRTVANHPGAVKCHWFNHKAERFSFVRTGYLGNQVGIPVYSSLLSMNAAHGQYWKKGSVPGSWPQPSILRPERPTRRRERKSLEALSPGERGWQEVGSSRSLFAYSGGSCHCDNTKDNKSKHYLHSTPLSLNCVWFSFWEWGWGDG